MRRTPDRLNTMATDRTWPIERHVLWRERRASVQIGGLRSRIVLVRNAMFKYVVGFEREVPLIVELVVVGRAVPLDIVITPLPAIDGVGARIDIVVALIPGIADTGGQGRGVARILQV